MLKRNYKIKDEFHLGSGINGSCSKASICDRRGEPSNGSLLQGIINHLGHMISLIEVRNHVNGLLCDLDYYLYFLEIVMLR